MKKELRNPGVIEFSASIIDAGGGGAYVEFPLDTGGLYGTQGRIPVKKALLYRSKRVYKLDPGRKKGSNPRKTN